MANKTNFDRSSRKFARIATRHSETIKSLLPKLKTAENVCEVRVNLENLELEYSNFKIVADEALMTIDPKKPEEAVELEELILAELDKSTVIYMPIISKAKLYITEYECERNREVLNNSLTGGNPDNQTKHNVKLPRISLPKFDGKIEEFLEFEALFKNVVHEEPSLSPVKKLYYLKESLSGKAADLIRDIPLSDRGYEEAWNLVISTYKDIKTIVRKHFDNLFGINRVKSSSEIPNLLASVNRSLKGLKACGEDPDNWQSILSYLITEKLDEPTYLEYEKTLTNNNKFPHWKHLRSFLELRSSITARRSEEKPVSRTPKTETKRTVLTTTRTETKPEPKLSKPKCVCCTKEHLLIECEDFKSKSPKDRFNLLKTANTCINCFKSNHKTSECRKSPNCRKCSQRHHTLLHFESKTFTNDDKQSSAPEVTTISEASASCASVSKSIVRECEKSFVLLPSAVVNAKIGNKCVKMRVLLDSCSQVNLITKSFVDRNNIQTSENRSSRTIIGVGNSSTPYNQSIKMRVCSITEQFEFDAIFDVFNSNIPYTCNLFTGDLRDKLCNFKLADPDFQTGNVNFEIDALLGVEAYDLCVRGDTRCVDGINLRNTHLGWTLSSRYTPQSDVNESYCGLTIDKIDERLQRFWEVENVTTELKSSSEAQATVDHFNQTYSREPDGTFVVRLPFKDDPTKITSNYNVALSFLNRNMRRMTEPTLSMYREFMKEYQELGHMTVVKNDNTPRYFIPHHAVLRPSSTTTKLRVVFHASSKSNSGLSLNDILMVGPFRQSDLFDILIRFRTYRYAFTSDVAKMYRCIRVHPDDRIYQSVLWNGEIHELNTVTYGTGPALLQAQMCLEKLANEAKEIDPVIAQFILENMYVDDFAGGADTVEQAIKLQKGVHNVLASGNFHLRKYQSNSPEVLHEIDPLLIENNLTVSFGKNESLSILGLCWSPSIDVFSLKADLEMPNTIVTKRVILSMISKVYDPLGLASPVTIRGKLLFQSLWKLALKWDDPVPEEIDSQFRSYLTDLNEIKEFSVPRYIPDFYAQTVMLIGFGDASETAYSAAVYAVTIVCNEPKFTLYAAKTRVAPIKVLKVPELELQASVLLVELIDRIRKTLKLDSNQVKLYTDSTIVLSWIAKPPSEWKMFVRNRVSKITSLYPANQWSHVRTYANPADLATRGLTSNQLMKSSLWQNGPIIVKAEPETASKTFEIDSRVEQYRSKSKTAVMVTIECNQYIEIVKRYSSYYKLQRVFATVLVIAKQWKLKAELRSYPKYTVDDLIQATQWLIRVDQENSFSVELQRLRENLKVPKRSPLRNRTPFLDENGLIHSRTRLQNAPIPFNKKCPIILHAGTHLTRLYIRHIHEKYFHANRPFILSYLSANFEYVGGISRVIKAEIKKCVQCIRYFQQSVPQQMADLPVDRVTPQPPFQAVGVDFTGAFVMKCSYHRMIKYVKAYAAIFVCFSTRAVHIELVPSLTTEDFLNALKCFVSRRGLPVTIYSDNGTNFRGAERYINFHDVKIDDFAKKNTIQWRFNTPYTPHRGGIWESAVKSAKRFIPIVTNGQTFTENELRTLLIQIECILNSRPLVYTKSSEPTEEVLTPSHFLIGRNLTIVPESENVSSFKLSTQYRANRQRIKDFWKLWSTDYLNQLKCRSKWFNTQPNLIEGQIVILQDTLSSPCEWKKARVIRTFPDANGLVRTVTVAYGNEQKTVPSNRAIVLPTS